MRYIHHNYTHVTGSTADPVLFAQTTGVAVAEEPR